MRIRVDGKEVRRVLARRRPGWIATIGKGYKPRIIHTNVLFIHIGMMMISSSDKVVIIPDFLRVGRCENDVLEVSRSRFK